LIHAPAFVRTILRKREKPLMTGGTSSPEREGVLLSKGMVKQKKDLGNQRNAGGYSEKKRLSPRAGRHPR